jgi:hypothetical protein
VDVNGGGGKRDKGKAREEGPRSAAPSNGGDKGKYGLGRKPDFDTSKAEELCGLEEGQCMPISNFTPFFDLSYIQMKEGGRNGFSRKDN